MLMGHVQEMIQRLAANRREAKPRSKKEKMLDLLAGERDGHPTTRPETDDTKGCAALFNAAESTGQPKGPDRKIRTFFYDRAQPQGIPGRPKIFRRFVIFFVIK